MPRSKAISEFNGLPSAAASNSTISARPRRQAREFLPTSVLTELWSIWQADPRVPSINSRRSWAISRDANPRLVDSWFLRRKAYAKKAGRPIPAEPYDLPLGAPITPKREQSVTATETELDAVPDLPSDDTLVYPPDDGDSNDVEASSDIIFDETRIEPQKTDSFAYKETPQEHFPEHLESQSEPSSSDFDAVENRSEDTPSFNDPSFPVCNQGQGEQSSFTCILCSENGIPDDVQSESDATSNLDRGELFTSSPRFDFLPETLSELSAIPFLFRTPSIVLFPDNAVSHQIVDNWTSVEDELGRLVNDGTLDFSFLDAPHLTSMELSD
ncbi:hypothetical protein JVU11DRAFT_3342 [Chiua virens]|nr:hypothetical protein JVU11DRAFT_3342 [Chiua virens]